MNGLGVSFWKAATLGNDGSEAIASEEFNLYIDSATGNDADSGLTPALAKQNLSAATWAGTTGFASDGAWAGTIIPTTSNRIGKYNSGAPPEFDGSVVIPNDSFTLSAATGNGGVVYEATLTPPGAQQLASTPFTMTAGAIDTRVVGSVANLAAATGPAFYIASPTISAASTTPFVLYYKAAGGVSPTTQGAEIRWTRFPAPIEFHDRTGVQINGLHATKASSVYGIINAGRNAYLRRCLASYGSKHHFLISSGRMDDCVAYAAELARVALGDGGIIPFTFYDETTNGLSWTAQRCMMIMPVGQQMGEAVYGHNSSGVAHTSGTVQKFFSLRGGRIGYLSINQTIEDLVSLDNARAAQMGGSATGSLILRRLHMRALVDATTPQISIPSAGAGLMTSATFEDNCVYRASDGTNAAIFGFFTPLAPGGTMVVRNNIFASYSGNDLFRNAANVGNSGISCFNNIFLLGTATNSIRQIEVATGYGTHDYNVFINPTANTRVYRTWNGTSTVNHASLAAYRAATGYDTNSVELNAVQADTLFLNGLAGLANGDFRINPACVLTFVDGTPLISRVGARQHYNWNSRALVDGGPSVWPTPPATLAECKTYIQDPTAWNFYP